MRKIDTSVVRLGRHPITLFSGLSTAGMTEVHSNLVKLNAFMGGVEHTTRSNHTSPAKRPAVPKAEPPALALATAAATVALAAPTMTSPSASAASAAGGAGAGAPAAVVAIADGFVEPILRENPHRYTLFPVAKPKLFAKYKNHMSVFWVPEEVDLSKDMKDWVKLTDNERLFIRNILGFFAGSDGIVQENLATRFMKEVQLPEARAFYAIQNAVEQIHSETYSLLIDTYIDDAKLKLETFRAIQTVPCVAKKAEWAKKWIESEEEDFATRLIGFAVVEGIFFSGAFCAIFWLKERGLMPGLTLSNEFIARDEGLHTEFACMLYEEIERKVPKTKVHKIIREAVKIEKEFITKSLPCDLIGMNSKLMSQYIEFVADRLSIQLGGGKIYSATNPFDFMERICMEGKDNFFEKRVSTYAKAGVGKKAEEMTFSTEEDF
jgi:ribonucleoside-diphosphate reductase beta chain